ncbi:MAG TPA: HDOD domain-containing protein [bacterium]|nr:HDOD domain-containing protein [bacterium]HOL47648.1 HDOD domain-containing protein [bacterium]HPQ19640.1 HDOD domain-containing protein [bacterium]
MNNIANSKYSIEKIVEKIEEKMPSLSPTAAKVIELVNNINCSPLELTKVIKLDPVLSAKVLKVVNSSYFALPQKITSLERAIIMLGLNTIKNLALSAALLSQFEVKGQKYLLDMKEFWKHSLAVGIVAKKIAIKRNIPKTEIEDYFLAGLIHDLGLLIENIFYPDEFASILKKSTEIGLINAEEEELNKLNHCKIGKAIGEKWNLSQKLINALYLHHDLPMVGENFEFILTISFANIICKKNNKGLVIDKISGEINPIIFNILNITEETINEIVEQLDAEIEKAQEFLKI